MLITKTTSGNSWSAWAEKEFSTRVRARVTLDSGATFRLRGRRVFFFAGHQHSGDGGAVVAWTKRGSKKTQEKHLVEQSSS